MVYLSLKKEPGCPLTKQIYNQLRVKILKGDLQAGERIPSSREMALYLNISRNTVVLAYEMLIAEGFLNSLPGKGIFVAEGALLADKSLKEATDYQFTAFTQQEIDPDAICFHSGTPALDLFPRTKWNQIAYRIFREAPDSVFGYDTPQGRPELRSTLADYLKKTRGIDCRPDQIVITSGAKQALTLTAKCLLSPEQEVLIEDPANVNVVNIFAYHTQAILPVPVDREGIRTDLLPTDSKPALIFITPSHQFPLGGVLSIQRRIELIKYANETGCYIIEDDYDSEFRYRGLPVSSLQGLDPSSVIYIGTFSKILFPSLRLGYLVLPAPLVDRITEWKRLGDHHSNSLDQLTLTRFIETGALERHIARMKRIYRQRRDGLIKCLNETFNGRVKLWGETAGMHMVAEFPEVDFTPELINNLARKGIVASTVAEHSFDKNSHRCQLILGYAHLTSNRIEEGIRRLKGVLDTTVTKF